MSGAGLTAPIPVLLYHRIADQGHDRFTVSTTRFVEHLGVLQASGRTPLTVSELGEALRGRCRCPQRPVAITFDDGYADTTESLLTLFEFGLRATLYVTVGDVGRSDALSHADLTRLAGAAPDVEIGAHTVSHPYLDSIPAARMRREVADSADALGQWLGRRPATFAYPHGAYDGQVRATVIAHGFTSAAGVKNAFSHERDDPWAVARLTVTDDVDSGRLEELLDGRGAPIAWGHERLRTRVARRWRRMTAGRRTGRPRVGNPAGEECR